MKAMARFLSAALVAVLCTSCGGSQPADTSDTSTTPGAGSRTRDMRTKAQERARERAIEQEQEEETQVD